MNTHTSDSLARAFADEIDVAPLHATLGTILLRATGAFGGGLAVTALLAAILHR